MSVIVGSRHDPHVIAVMARMVTEPIVVDAASFLSEPITVTGSEIVIEGRRLAAGRGWLRRLAPEGWAHAMDKPGVDAASLSAAMSALAAVMRDERFMWLSPLDALGAAENKPLQYRRAAAVGVPVPEWMVTTDPAAIPVEGAWVSKPLGPGSFIDDNGQGWIVPTTAIDVRIDREVLVRVPFVLQRRLEATVHARVVTVGEEVHSATLPAGDLPLDWRLSAVSHHAFSTSPAPDFVHGLVSRV